MIKLTNILQEGVFDNYILNISRDVVMAFKNKKGYKRWYTLYRGGEEAEFQLKVKFIENKNIPYSHSIEGGGDMETLDITIVYNPTAFPAAMNDLVAEVKETITHELEHVGQQNFEDMYVNNGKFYKDYINYLTSPVEVPAYVKGLIKRANTKRISLSAMMDQWYNENKLNFVEPGSRWSYVKTVWLKWAYDNRDKLKKFT